MNSRWLFAIGGLSLAFLSPALAQPLNTTFTYQGELRSGSNPAEGLHDMRFLLFDAALAGGGAVGVPLCADDINIVGGRFTVDLDFGAVFAGQQRYLEIWVRADTGLDCSNLAGFVQLDPRVPLHAAPHASFSLSAGTAASATTANTATSATTAGNATQFGGQAPSFYQNAANLISGTIPSARLGGAYTGALVMENPSNSFAGSGAGLVGLNASNITTGTLSDARLSGNAALLSNAQTFSGVKTFSSAPAFTSAGAPFTVTSGTLVTNLNADRLDGLHASAFLQAVPNPLSLAGAAGPNTAIIAADNSSTEFNAMGLFGQASGTTGFTFGVQGRSLSNEGVGVIGWAPAASGNTRGIHGVSSSTEGTGVSGHATAPTGATTGIHGVSDSADGRGVYGEATAATGVNYGGFFRTNSTSGAGLRATGPSTGGYFELTGGSGYALRAQAPSTTGTTWAGLFTNESSIGVGVQGEVFGSAGSGTGVYGISHGITGIGVRGHASLTGASSGTSYGGYFSTFGETGRGVYGLAHSGTGNGPIIGVEGRANSTTGIGVQGSATAATGLTVGVKGISGSPNGTGVYGEATAIVPGANYGVIGRAWNANGVGVYGHVPTLDNNTTGVYAVAASTAGTALRAWATAGTGAAHAVVGQSDSTGGTAGHFRGRGPDAVFVENVGAGRGMHIIAPSDTAMWAETTTGFAAIDGRAASACGRAIYGSNSATTGDAFGVVGQTGSAAGWALYGFGKSGSSGAKSFRIDHPADPENKYLLHYSSESPEVINFYRGTVMLDAAGSATVQLPDYFARINRDPSYQLTAVGAPMPMLHVSLEVDAADLAAGAAAAPGEPVARCWFQIAGGQPHGKVSWRVEAVRNDRWMQEHGAPIETDKEGPDRGTYQHPEFYNQPAERGTNHRTPAPSAAPPVEPALGPVAVRPEIP